MERMSTLDAGFFFVEHDNVPMHIGSLAVFEGPMPAYDDVIGLFEAKLPQVPLRRLAVVREQMDGLKRSYQAVSAEILTGMLGFAAPMWLALGTQVAFRIRQPLVQTVTTNVPGPRSPLYVLGRPMTALYPYVPIGNAVRLSVAILSYVDTVSFGVTADYDATPDLDTFTEGIRRSLAELGGRPAREGTGS